MIKNLRKVLFLLAICCANVVAAQNISVASFKHLENDITANTTGTIEYDFDGEVAALIKVVTTEQGFTFDCGMTGIVKAKQGVGEIWVYVPQGIQRISIHHQQLGVLRDYFFPIAIEKANTYEMVLTTGTLISYVEEDAGGNFLWLKPTPKDATVYIDDVECSHKADGDISIMLPYGEHTYRVEAHDYITEAGTFTIGKERKELEVVLKSALATLTLVSPIDDGKIYLNGEYKGIGKWTGEVKAGDHVAEVRKEMHRAVPEKFTLEVEDKKTVNLKAPEVTYATLTIKNPMEDADIFINEELKGQGSWTGIVNPGMYALELRKASHRTVKETIHLGEKDVRTVSLNAPVPIYGQLYVDSNPTGCDVHLNGELLGKSPNIFKKVLIGEHKVTVSKNGYEKKDFDVVVEEGKQAKVVAEMSTGGNVQQLPIKSASDTSGSNVTTTKNTRRMALPIACYRYWFQA